MYSLRLIVSIIYFCGLLFPINSWAQNDLRGSSNNIPMVLKRPSDYMNQPSTRFSTDELKFIVAFKSYSKALLHIQASETKKKLICLGAENLTDLDLANNTELRNLVNAYKNSEECRQFLDVQVPELIGAYSELRINLALHQGTSDEMRSLSYRMGSMGQIIEDPIDCEAFESPLRFGATNFCFNRIRTIMDVQPEHILKKFSLNFLDKPLRELRSLVKTGELQGSVAIPEVVNLPPLTWEEVLVATDIFHGYFTDNEHNVNFVLDELSQDEDQKVRDSLADRHRRYEEDIVKYHRDIRRTQSWKANYFSAKDFQAQGAYVFSQYPEVSAPRKYMDIVSAHPVLAFYEPNLKTINLNCNSEEMVSTGTVALCHEYVQNLPRNHKGGIAFSLSRSKDIYPKLAEAYRKVLTLNTSLIKALDFKYNTENLFKARGQLVENIVPEYVSNWSDLLSMDVALKNFLDMYPEYQGQEEQFLKIKGRQELFSLGLMIGAAVGAGFACGMMGGWPLLVCLGGAGLGVNVAFYADTLYRHDNLMMRYFSTSSHETSDGLKLGLIEFESYKMEVQMLVVDTLLLGVGISAGRMTRLTKELVSGAHKKASINYIK